MPAVIRPIGAPLNGAGTSASAMRSRMAAKNTSTIPKPAAAPNPYKADCSRLCCSWTFNNATPSTAQLLVISGRKIPSTRYSTGTAFAHEHFGQLYGDCDNQDKTQCGKVFQVKRLEQVLV